ncbi:MAG: hypothetical protein V4557_12450 [Bacteroidota bacterium]
MEKTTAQRVAYLEKEFNQYYRYLRDSSSYMFEMMNFMDITNYDKKIFSEYWSYEYLYRMYNILCAYFETLGLPHYLERFIKEFQPIIDDKKKATDILSIPLTFGDSEEDLTLLIEWKKFLAPFDFFWTKLDKKEIHKVKQLIECTNQILKLTKTKVFKEDDINRIMRSVANFYFSDVSAYSEGYFEHNFKHYKPDLIIKETGTAIEYKLIRDNSEIGTKMDELIIDAKRYAGNPLNRECIAVFCLSTAVNKTMKEIREDWEKMKFPSNWELIIIDDVMIEPKKMRVTQKA